MKKLIVLKTLSSQIEADIILGLLKSNGIYSFSTADDCGGVQSFMNSSMGVKVWVKEGDFEKALFYLEEE
ncbi:MAG: DUF2007 domain-containing protein [Bdellovibrionota bacterium]|nr:DUF2007 domain-containing protein [Bdellovibrionota bacterium]